MVNEFGKIFRSLDASSKRELDDAQICSIAHLVISACVKQNEMAPDTVTAKNVIQSTSVFNDRASPHPERGSIAKDRGKRLVVELMMSQANINGTMQLSMPSCELKHEILTKSVWSVDSS